MPENKYHIKIARDETRSMGRAERLWYKGTAKWFLLFGLIVLAGVGLVLAYLSVHSNPVPKVSGARIINPVVENTSPHFYVKIQKGTAQTSTDGGVWQAAKNGNVVESGHFVQTGNDSYVTLISNQDSIVRLGPNSQLVINDVSAPSAKIFSTNLKLQKGQAWTHIVTKQDEKITWALSTTNFLVSASAGTFSVESGTNQRVASTEGTQSVKQISEATGSDSILKDSVTHEYSVPAGKTVVYKGDGSKLLDVLDIASSLASSYWWTWNKEQDADYERSLKNTVSDNGPPLTLDNTAAVIAIADPYFTVSGRTSLDARIFVNNFEIANQAGIFSYKVAVPDGMTTAFPVNVVAVDHLGNRTVKTFSLSLLANADNAEKPVTTSNGVALNLSAKSLEGGVELVWNSVPAGATFDGYHIVRSESNDTLSFPKNEAFVEIPDAKTATFLDISAADQAQYFYRVCVKSEAERYDCSNVYKIVYKKPVVEGGGA